MRRFFLLFPFFFITACANTIEMAPPYKHGEYKIAGIEITPATAELGNDPEYFQAKNILEPLLKDKIIGKGTAPDIKLQIIVTDVSLEINTGRALLIGDSYRLATLVKLLEFSTNREIGKLYIISKPKNSAGVYDLLPNVFSEEDDHRLAVFTHYITLLETRLFPSNQ